MGWVACERWPGVGLQQVCYGGLRYNFSLPIKKQLNRIQCFGQKYFWEDHIAKMTFFGEIRSVSLRKLQSGLAAMVSVVAFLFGIVGTFAAILIPLFNTNVQNTIASATISVMFGSFVIWSIHREYKIARKEKYANISRIMSAVSNQSKELSLKLTNALNSDVSPSPELLMGAVDVISHILDDVVGIFSLLTGTRCRAALKVIGRDEGQVWAHALARDRMSAANCAHSDKDRNERKFDLIEQNIDFEILYDDKKDDVGYYFNNNMLKSEYYSTSLRYHQESSTSHVWKSADGKDWPLPYRSAIVWPIRQDVNSTVSPRLFYGFLAVDSESRGVFEERWDSAIGNTIAHQLFLPLHLYHKLEGRISKE